MLILTNVCSKITECFSIIWMHPFWFSFHMHHQSQTKLLKNNWTRSFSLWNKRLSIRQKKNKLNHERKHTFFYVSLINTYAISFILINVRGSYSIMHSLLWEWKRQQMMYTIGKEIFISLNSWKYIVVYCNFHIAFIALIDACSEWL